MARRRESLFESLILLPWWVGVLAAISGCGSLAFAWWFFDVDEHGRVAQQLYRVIAYVWAVVCLGGAGVSAVRHGLIRRIFERQRGIEDIRRLSWQQFEAIVGEAFRRRGYFVLENGGGGADGGVDLVLRRDGRKFYVQCKQWKKSKIGVKAVREFFGVMSAARVDGGFFVASGTYTTDAREFATKTGIVLIDGPDLERMVREVRNSEPLMEPTASRRDVTSHPAQTSNAPSCPLCGNLMVLRTAKRGANAGKDFWGCSNYPACRGIRALADD